MGFQGHSDFCEALCFSIPQNKRFSNTANNILCVFVIASWKFASYLFLVIQVGVCRFADVLRTRKNVIINSGTMQSVKGQFRFIYFTGFCEKRGFEQIVSYLLNK